MMVLRIDNTGAWQMVRFRENQQLTGLDYCFIYQMKGYLILYFGMYCI